MNTAVSFLMAFLILSGSAKTYNEQSVFTQSSIRNDPNSEQHSLARDIFNELIDINTTSKFGSTKAAEAMAVRLKSAGFPASDIQVIGPDLNHKNLVFRYHGSGKLKPLLFICHLDIVEALRDDWSVDPFKFIEKDGYFYGRGTTDVKNSDASLIADLIQLKNEGYKPDRDIIIALTADEEAGNANGVNWLIKNHYDLIDADYCINPDGGGGGLKNGKPFILAIQTSEKKYVTYNLEVKNNGGHSSVPVKENAIYTLAAGLLRLSDYDFPVRLNETTRSFFQKIASSESDHVKADILAVLSNPSDSTAIKSLSSESALYNALMRTTCVATMISGGHAENALPQTAKAVVNCRLLPDDSPENVMSVLETVLADSIIKITGTDSVFSVSLSPLREDVTVPVVQIASSMWPGVNVIPYMDTGASDGLFLRKKGMQVYGVSGMFGDMDDDRMHGKDERIGVKEFYDGVDFMYRLIKALASEKTQ
jgi:acetylornithine deacetylase/succinyl-diaminopimelate desuccinylase-like protein